MYKICCLLLTEVQGEEDSHYQKDQRMPVVSKTADVLLKPITFVLAVTTPLSCSTSHKMSNV